MEEILSKVLLICCTIFLKNFIVRGGTGAVVVDDRKRFCSGDSGSVSGCWGPIKGMDAYIHIFCKSCNVFHSVRTNR